MNPKLLSILVLIVFSFPAMSQKVDSIFFHLYTDSLKKGQHNYINVDGKLSNGRWLPLTSKEINFSCGAASCIFSGNELFVPPNFPGDRLTVKAALKNDPSVSKEITIWIKKIPDPDRLPTKNEILKKNIP